MCAKMIVTIVTIVTLSGADGRQPFLVSKSYAPYVLELCSVSAKA